MANINNSNFSDLVRDKLEDDENIRDEGSITSYEDNIQPQSEYDSSASSTDYEPKIPEDQGPIVKGKNGFRWSLVLPPISRTAHRNIVRIPKARRANLNINNEKDTFLTLIEMPVIERIVTFTNL